MKYLFIILSVATVVLATTNILHITDVPNGIIYLLSSTGLLAIILRKRKKKNI